MGYRSQLLVPLAAGKEQYTPLVHTSLIQYSCTASYIVGVKQPDSEKVSVYECSFDPFESSRIPLSVRFFLVGILFMNFDLEISFLFLGVWFIIKLDYFGSLSYVFLFILGA